MKFIVVYRAQPYVMALLPTRTLGQIAEREACTFLKKRGLKFITSNYQCRCGEIDLIMQDNKDIIFIEVRNRNCTDYGNALETINSRKQKKIIKTALYFLQTKNWLNKVNCRFDVIGIKYVAETLEIDWIKDAFSTEQFAHL